MDSPMRQHYVPRFYLELFVDPDVPLIESDYLWECHLPTAAIKRRAPKNVAVRTDYYKIPGVAADVAQMAEETLSQIESVAAPILRRLASGDLELVDQDRADFLFFLAFMSVRVPVFRDRLESFFEEAGRKMLMVSASHPGHFKQTMTKAMKAAGEPMLSEDEIEKQRLWTLNPDNYKVDANPGLSLMHGFKLANDTICPMFMEMRWVFFRAPKGVEFITSDCPLSWYDPTPRPPFYGGHGLGMRGVEVTFPITPTTVLLGTHEGPEGVHDADLAQVLLFNLRKLYWAAEHAYAASKTSARQALALAMFAASQINASREPQRSRSGA
jgi:hypothetical protein